MNLLHKMDQYSRLVPFFITQRGIGFDIPDEPHFDEGSQQIFDQLIRDCSSYLEYGSGGSTVVAARLGKPFISVDTDRFYMNAVKKKVSDLSPLQKFVHADIGVTGPWGVPLKARNPSPSRLTKWKDYPNAPWRIIDEAKRPDLILIDGRFRVAAALTCLLKTISAPHTYILFDDYFDRPDYHGMEEFIEPLARYGRMALFQPQMQESGKLTSGIEKYSADWR